MGTEPVPKNLDAVVSPEERDMRIKGNTLRVQLERDGVVEPRTSKQRYRANRPTKREREARKAASVSKTEDSDALVGSGAPHFPLCVTNAYFLLYASQLARRAHLDLIPLLIQPGNNSVFRRNHVSLIDKQYIQFILDSVLMNSILRFIFQINVRGIAANVDCSRQIVVAKLQGSVPFATHGP